jgi:hypothetical protein
MRPILALVMLLLGLVSASPEPEYALLVSRAFGFATGTIAPPLIEIESSTVKADRPIFAALATGSLDQFETVLPQPSGSAPAPDTVSIRPAVSLGELCNALLTSAQDNELPVAFFANLIWQESHLRDDAVSPKGALGIAQFMPETAVESGLDNPLDAMQAIPASARLLRELRLQFGNLGFAAAAYNAGPHRVSAWLAHHRALPRETRGYVVQVTGRSIEQWRSMPPHDAALRFVRPLPCRDLPPFAELDEAQAEQAQLGRAQMQRMQILTRQVHGPEKIATAGRHRRQHLAYRRRWYAHHRHDAIRATEREGHRRRHEAGQHYRRGTHDKRKNT